LLFSPLSFAGKIYEEFPEEISINEKYVFYSHGLIVEGDNSTPISPKWGKYEFPKVKEALSDEGYNLIAYHRPENTNPLEYAEKLAGDVHALMEQGVSPENITLLGFSRGGEITILASNNLKHKKIRVVLLASCPVFMKDRTDYEVYGNIYSVFETSDMVGSCQFLIDQSQNVDSFNEIAISTGEEHGAFFRPMSEWVIPVKTWLGFK